MFQKKISVVLAVGLLTQVSLCAMDMDRVNAIAQKIKASISGSSTTIVKEISQQNRVVETAVSTPKEVSSVPAALAAIDMVSEESLGLRKTDLYSEEAETTGEKTQYGSDAPGTSKRFERAYENAPPMIPHSVEGLLPIKVGNNACLGCHMPEVAPSMKATPIPPSHFASFRPITKIGVNGEVVKEGKAVVNTSDVKTVIHKLEKLSTARFNCSQCHAPQSTQKPLVKNTFEPDFISKEGQKRSNLIDTINEGVE